MSAQDINRQTTILLVIRMGLIFGISGILFILFQLFSGNLAKGIQWTNLILFVINGILATFMVKHYRNMDNLGYITFGKSFKITFWSLIIGGFIAVWFNFLVTKLLYPDIQNQVLKVIELNFVKEGIPDKQAEKILGVYKLILLNPFLNGLLFLANYALYSLVTSLVVARLTKRVSMGFLSED